ASDAAGGVGGAARGKMNRPGVLALLLVATAGWLAFRAVLRYWPTMLLWFGVVSDIVYVASIVLYLRSSCELCRHACMRHFTSPRPWTRCAICGCEPGARDMRRWPLLRWRRRS